MAWVESHQELGRHPKTRRASKLLSVSRAAVIGHLHCLWWWALDFAQDGVLTKFEADEIADACLWDGEPEALVAGLVGAGFLDAVEGQLVVHDWGDYAGRLIERRTSDAERKRRERESARAVQDVPRTSGGHPSDDPGMSCATVPNRTVTYPTLSEGNDTGDSEPQDIRRDSHDDDSGSCEPPPVAAVADAGDDPALTAPKPPKLKTVYGEESDAMQLAREFARGLREVKPDVKLPKQADGWQSWAREFDLMARVDHRPREKIVAVMAYARRSSFWRSVVLSPRSLREKFDRLDLQREEDANNGRVSGDRRHTAGGRGSGPARGRGSDAGAGPQHQQQHRSYPKLDAGYYDRVRERSAAAASGE